MLGDVADILRLRGSEGWLVGGSVRDRLSGRYSPDLDIVVADDAAAVAKHVAASLHAPWFALSDRYPTYRVLGLDGHVDIAEVRGKGILDDLAERDFTVNAMAVPAAAWLGTATPDEGVTPGLPDEAKLLDPFEGAVHLGEKRLVAVSDHIFVDDPLRLMRAARFCHTLGLEPDDGLTQMVKEHASRLTDAAAERIVSEMCISLGAGRSVDAVRLWESLGLLEVLLPELRQAAHDADEDRLSRILGSLQALDDALSDLNGSYPESAEFLTERLLEPVDGAVNRPVALRWAALTSGLSADQVRALGRRLKLSGALASLLTAVARCSTLALEHGPGSADGSQWLLAEGESVGRAAVLYMWEASPWEPEVVLVVAAGAGRVARRLMAMAVERARGDLAPLPMDGEVLMRELGLESGPVLGRALQEARLAWESQEATSRSDLLEVARRAVREG